MPFLHPQDCLTEDYRVERFLGEGAFAEVYRVEHRFLGRQAMKVFKSPCEDLEQIQHDLGEAILLSKMGHPNIIRVFNAGITKLQGQTHGFFTMEHVSGGTLDRFRHSQGPSLLPVDMCVELVRQASEGLAIAHNANPPIVHRDIKPQNLLVGEEHGAPRVRLSDFGLAKQVNPMTLMLSARGTLCYKAPEAFSNTDSRAGDIWAMGCVLFNLLTDTHPFPRAAKVGDTVKRSDFRDYRPPSRFNFRVDEALDDIAARCLAFDPDDRIPDASALLEALHAWKGPAIHKTDSRTRSGEHMDASNQPQTDAELQGILRMAQNPSRLQEAASLLESWLIVHPEAWVRYGETIKLWQRGVSM